MSDGQAATIPDGATDTPHMQALALSQQELRAMLLRPLRALDMVLGQRRRFATNVALEHRLPMLALVLATTTVAFALPFGAVLRPVRFWTVPALLLGAMLICLPSLHVLIKFLGARVSSMQTLCLALASTATASLFSFAFAPIVGFMRATMNSGGVVTAQGMATVLLLAAVCAGTLQHGRLVKGALGMALIPVVFAPWLGLYLFITARLGGVLGLF